MDSVQNMAFVTDMFENFVIWDSSSDVDYFRSFYRSLFNVIYISVIKYNLFIAL